MKNKYETIYAQKPVLDEPNTSDHILHYDSTKTNATNQNLYAAYYIYVLGKFVYATTFFSSAPATGFSANSRLRYHLFVVPSFSISRAVKYVVVSSFSKLGNEINALAKFAHPRTWREKMRSKNS